jgi:hypothetical protein
MSREVPDFEKRGYIRLFLDCSYHGDDDELMMTTERRVVWSDWTIINK